MARRRKNIYLVSLETRLHDCTIRLAPCQPRLTHEPVGCFQPSVTREASTTNLNFIFFTSPPQIGRQVEQSPKLVILQCEESGISNQQPSRGDSFMSSSEDGGFPAP